MQIKQIVVGLTSAGLLGVTPLVLAGPATAATAVVSGHQTAATTVDSARAAKVERKIKIRVPQKKVRGNKGILVKGRLKPKSKSKQKVIIKRANAVDGKYKTFKRMKTGKKGKFSLRLPAPANFGKRFYWKFIVKGNKKYKRAEIGGYYTQKTYF